MRLQALTVALVLGCQPAPHPPPTDVAATDAHDAARDVVLADVAPAPLRPSLVAGDVAGSATLNTTLRLRSSDAPAALRLVLPDDAPIGLSALRAGRGTLPGDVITTGAGARVRLDVGDGLHLHLGADAVVEVPAYAGAATILTRGVARLQADGGEALRVDTPAARVIVSSGSCLVGVAIDGSVAIFADGPGVTVWASPAPPPPRPTRLTDAERARLRAQSSHPVLLDVDIPELAAQQTRPVVAAPLAQGSARGFDPLGLPHRRPLPARPTAASVERWLSEQSIAPVPYAHLLPIGQLSRAGSGDLADVRVVLAHFQTQPQMPQAARESLLAQMSLALGRATARARRGRELATRGGDSTALVQIAAVEPLTDASRALAPLRLR